MLVVLNVPICLTQDLRIFLYICCNYYWYKSNNIYGSQYRRKESIFGHEIEDENNSDGDVVELETFSIAYTLW